jgi:hypothetical protein
MLGGCASSRSYRPLPWEAELYQAYGKYPFPNEVVPDTDSGKSLQWLGVIDTFWVEGNDSASSLYIKAQHKYWDYVEDFSIQREKMFVSPFGGGPFVYRKEIANRPIDTVYKDMAELAHKNNIGIFYGKIAGSRVSPPLLDGTRARFIHRQFYSTGIWSYEIKKDSAGNYRMENLKILKVAGPGINDPEDKEFE